MDVPTRPDRWGRFRLGVQDVSPLRNSPLFWQALTRGATIGLFVLALVAALDYSRPVLLPVVLALVIGIILQPISDWAAEQRIPHWLTAVVLVVGFFAAGLFALVYVADPVRDWIERGPEIAAVVKERLQIFDRPLAALNSLRESLDGGADGAGSAIRVDVKENLLEPAIAVLTPALGQIMLFFGTLFFFLVSPDSARQPILFLSTSRDARLRTLRIFRDIEHNLASTFAIVTGINLALGIVTTALAYAVGLPTPVAWGLLAFSLNFIPYIGAALVIVAMFGVGLISFDSLSHALVAPLSYLTITTIEGHFITPSILGRRLTINPLMIFLALGFWTWLWGPLGALLAVPLLIIGMVVMNHLFPNHDPKLPG